ncbi:hypothetical protein AB3S75_034143 [Citrus x aurantiifolia]
MAKTQKPHQLGASIILFFLIISSLSSLSSARVLRDDYIPQRLAITEPEAAFSIALPSDNVEALKNTAEDGIEQHPCHDASSPPKLAGKLHRPLVLNVLPKGTTPPSGPSKGINDVNN